MSDMMLGVFLDTEASGLNANKHKILEIAFRIVDLKSGKVLDEFESIVSTSYEDFKKSDEVSLSVNGLTWDVVQKGMNPKEVSQKIQSIFKNHNIIRGEAVFICQNPSFDRVFFSQLIDPDAQEHLKWPYHWLDLASMYWSCTMKQALQKKSPFPWDTGFTKDKIAKHFELPAEATPHRAMNGVDHLVKCYEAVVGFPDKKS